MAGGVSAKRTSCAIGLRILVCLISIGWGRVCLFISGSHIHAMESLLKSDAPLFGRMTGKLFVPAFEFTEIAPFVERYSLEKQLAVYAIVGGIPDYLRRWDDRVSLMENVREIFLTDLSPFRNEAEILISDVLRR